MDDERQTEVPLARRHLLRGCSLAAGAAVLGATLNSKTAEAADGDTLRLGRDNESGTTTTITIDGATGGQGYPPSGVPAAASKVGVQRRLSRQAKQREQLIRSIQNP